MSLDILIPHYRDPAGFAAALASIGGQSWTGDIRIVVVDDGSPDADFRAVEARLAGQPFPFVLERNAENRGRPYTRNRLLDSIEADYVAWLDAGDVWYPEKLALQFEHVHRLRFAGADVDRIWVTCHYHWQREGARRRLVKQEVGGEQLRELLLGLKLRAYLWTLLAPAGTFRAVGRFDERLPRLQDLDYFIRFLRAGGSLAVPPATGALCCYHKSDLGRSAHEIRRCNRQIFEKYRTSFEEYGRDFLSTIRYNAETLSARYAKHNGDVLGRTYYAAKAFVAHPRLGLGRARRWLAASR